MCIRDSTPDFTEEVTGLRAGLIVPLPVMHFPHLNAVLTVVAMGVVGLTPRPIREVYGVEGPEPNKVTLAEHVGSSDPHASSG